jgi:preprotein translocase SecE subunit
MAKKEVDISTEVKPKKVKKEKKAKKDGYFKVLNKEMKKVEWPSGKELVKYSIAVILFVIVLALFFEAVNFITSLVKGLF